MRHRIGRSPRPRRLGAMSTEPAIVNGRVFGHPGATGEPLGSWLPNERISIGAASEADGSGSAFAAFGDHRRGRLAVGHDAGLAVLDRDLLADGASAIIGTTTLATLVGGRVVHRSEGAA